MEILGEEVDMTDDEMQTTSVRTMTNDVSRLVNKKPVYFKTKLLQRLKSTVQFLYIASCCVKRKLYHDIGYFATRETKPFMYHIITQYPVIKLFLYNAL